MRRFYMLLAFLFSLCFCFIILSPISFAFSWNDYIDFCSRINNVTITDANTTWIANRIKNNKSSIETAILNAGYNLNDYHSFIAIKSGSYNYLFLINKTITYNYNYKVSGVTKHYYLSNMNNLPVVNINNYTCSNNTASILYGDYGVVSLLENSNTYGNDSDYNKNRYIYSVIRTTDFTGHTSPYTIADAGVGNTLYNVNFGWYLVQNNNYIKLNEQFQDGTYNKIFELELTDSMLEQINKVDFCYLIYGTTSTNIYQSDTFLIDYQLSPPPSGTITNLSGDITGSIDLSGIEYGIQSVNNSIQDQISAIISGDNMINDTLKENQSFWENTYNNLFSMSSGDVNDIYLMVQSYFPSGDTPLTVYDTIFGAYGNEPDDFIIRWEDIPLNITWFGGQQLYSGDFIHAGYMNFSKECRDNEVLGNIKFWLNTLLTIFIFIAYYKFLYNCYCDMLGVISEDIQEEPPEHRPIGFGRGDK